MKCFMCDKRGTITLTKKGEIDGREIPETKSCIKHINKGTKMVLDSFPKSTEIIKKIIEEVDF